MANQEISTSIGPRPDNTIGVGTIIEDGGKSFVQSAVITPLWNGVGQLVSCGYLPQVSIVNAENAKKSAVDSWAQKIGGALGMAVDFVALSKFKNGVLGRAVDTEPVQSLSVGERALTGAINGAKLGAFYGAVLTPSDTKGNLIMGRIANAGSQAINIGMLSGGSGTLAGLKVLGKIQPGTLASAIKDMGITGAVGIPAGATGAVAGSWLNGRKLSASDVREAATDNGIMGFALAGITHGLGASKGVEPVQALDATAARAAGNFSVASALHLNRAIGLPNLSKSGPNFQFLGEPRGFDDSDSNYSSRAGEWDQNVPSVDEAEERIRDIKSMMSNIELPVSATSDASTWRFIPEKASMLDSMQLELPLPAHALEGSTERGDKIVQIKRYINSTGQPAHEYLARLLKTSDVTIIGEQHTVDGPNPHRVLGKEVISQLPAGSKLAVELPSSLRPLFEEFNNNPGSDFQLTSPIADRLSLQPSLSLLRAAQSYQPELIDMWKSVRDKGIRVIPIDGEPDPSVELTSEAREGKLAHELLGLSHEDSKPVVAWIGDVHAARNTEAGVPLLAQRIAQSPEFASGRRKLSTVFSQISETDAERLPLQVLAKNVSEPVAIPTRPGGQESPISNLPVLPEATAKAIQAPLIASDYDHVIMYPPASAEMVANHYKQRVEALTARIYKGGFDDFDSSLVLDLDPLSRNGELGAPFESTNPGYRFDGLDSNLGKIHEFEVSAPERLGDELQRVFGTNDLRTISPDGAPFSGADGLRVYYRPEFYDLLVEGYSQDYPGRSMILDLSDQGLPYHGSMIDDPSHSLADIFRSNGLPLLAATMGH